jgi:diguanylate cyclase (GGDEF)-like protein
MRGTKKVNLLMKESPLKRRLAAIGLIAVLLVLTVCSIGATLLVREASLQTSEAVHMSDLYQQAHYLLGAGSSIMNEYVLQPDAAARTEFRLGAQKLDVTLQTIAADGDSNDRAFVHPLRMKQDHYLLLADHFFALIDAHDLSAARTLHQEQIDPLFDPMDEQVGTAANTDHQLATQSLAHLDTIQRLVIGSTVLMFVVGLFLLLFFWKMIRGYQRQLHTTAQAELLRMGRVALTDPLTGLPNHGAIIERIEAELQQCQSSQRNCAIIFVDVDHFKHINDTWGHAAGDAALREVGQRLRTGIRKDDGMGRYGGEEFAILLSDIEQQDAFDLAERLRCSIAEAPCLWQQEGTQTTIRIPLTASFGLATYPLDGLITRELLEMADSAMYMAKHSGRNRVCLSDEVDMTALMGEKKQQGPQYNEQGIMQTISTMATFHDQDTQAHANRMIRVGEATMRALGRSEDEVALLRLAVQLHDIGKIGIPEAILHKPGPLSEDEWEIMRQHPQIGQQILTPAKGQFGLVSHIVVAHHERWDGQGYPNRLAQQEIPLGARILSVIDSYDAMTSSRPYREALSMRVAREELQRGAGSQFDPQVVEAFLRVLDACEQPPAPAFMEEWTGDEPPAHTRGDALGRETLRN